MLRFLNVINMWLEAKGFGGALSVRNIFNAIILVATMSCMLSDEAFV